MADTITSTRLTLPTNTGAEVRFNTLAEVVRFAELNARRVSNTLEALLKCTADDSQKEYALELLVDVAYQVAGAAELLSDEFGTRATAAEVAHG